VQRVVSIAGLAQTRSGLVAGQPYVLIDELPVRNQAERRRRRSNEAEEPQLDVSLELSGFVREASV
jgi:hypothetical protein